MQFDVFGFALRAYRESHGLSQQDLASILGTSKQVISRYETGQREPKIGLAKKYAQTLGLPLSYFLGKDFEDEDNSIGVSLKKCRLSKNYSLDEVVFRLKNYGIFISAETLSDIEAGQPIRLDVFRSLCCVYSISNIITVFLSSVQRSKTDWDKGTYEDYFNCNTVNEKFNLLLNNGIPSFDGYSNLCSSDVFFGFLPEQDTLSDFERAVLKRLRCLPENEQRALLSFLSGTKTQEP